MTNLNVQSKLPSASAAANPLPVSGATDPQAGLAFDVVLQQQVDAKPDAKLLGVMDDKKLKFEKDIIVSKTQDAADPANIAASADQAANMIALMQPLQELRTPLLPQAHTETLVGKIMTDQSSLATLSSEKTAKRQDTGIDQNLATIFSGKADVAATLTSEKTAKRQSTGIDQILATNLSGKAEVVATKDLPLDVKKSSSALLKSLEQTDLSVSSEKTAAQFAQNQNIVPPNPAEVLKVSANSVLSPVTDNAKNYISTPLGTEGWKNEFTQKISWMTTSQLDQVAELHLNPPDLGPLSVVLKISDNQATATFTSAHSAVREAVENAMPKLREILADNGITLGNTTVSDQSPRDNNASSFSGQQSFAQGSRTPLPNTDVILATAPQVRVTQGRRHNGMVDTFA